MLQLPVLGADERPLPNARTQCGRTDDRRLLKITREEGSRASDQWLKRKKSCPGYVFAPSLPNCDPCSWPYVWRAPPNQQCESREARRYILEAEVESSLNAGVYTRVWVKYVDRASMSEIERQELNHVRGACSIFNQVMLCEKLGLVDRILH